MFIGKVDRYLQKLLTFLKFTTIKTVTLLFYVYFDSWVTTLQFYELINKNNVVFNRYLIIFVIVDPLKIYNRVIWVKVSKSNYQKKL